MERKREEIILGMLSSSTPSQERKQLDALLKDLIEADNDEERLAIGIAICRIKYWFFDSIPKELQTQEVILTAVSVSGGKLRHASKKLLNETICQIAVRNSGLAIFHVPSRFMTDELCADSLRFDREYLEEYISGPDYTKMKTTFKTVLDRAQAYARENIEEDPTLLSCLPGEYATKLHYEAAFNQSKRLIQYIPDHFLTLDMCHQAVQEDPRLLFFVPQRYVSRIEIGLLEPIPYSSRFPKSYLTRISEDQVAIPEKYRSPVVEFDLRLEEKIKHILYKSSKAQNEKIIKASPKQSISCRNRTDGIHTISSLEYQEYGKFFVNDGQLIMLKQSDIMMFFYQNQEGLYLLNGGRKTLATHEIAYYQKNMNQYLSVIERIFYTFNLTLSSLSRDVILMGGSGVVHGCIVDIDFFNHIFVNPFDGSTTPYFATSTVNKFVYPDLQQLLSERATHLLNKYNKRRNDFDILNDREETLPCISEVFPNNSTDIYKVSNKVKIYQDILNLNVVKVWNENLLQNPSSVKLLPYN